MFEWHSAWLGATTKQVGVLYICITMQSLHTHFYTHKNVSKRVSGNEMWLVESAHNADHTTVSSICMSAYDSTKVKYQCSK